MMIQEVRAMNKREIVTFLEKHGGKIHTHDPGTLSSCLELCREQSSCRSIA